MLKTGIPKPTTNLESGVRLSSREAEAGVDTVDQSVNSYKSSYYVPDLAGSMYMRQRSPCSKRTYSTER